MSLIATAGEGKEFELCPIDTHIARCFKVIDLGTQHSDLYDKDTPKVMIGWELPNTKMSDGRPFSINKWYTVSTHEKSPTSPETWKHGGASPSRQRRLKAFNLMDILGAPCFLGIVHEEKGGKMRDVVKSLTKLPQGTDCPMGVNESISFSLDPEEFDRAVFDSLSDGLKDIIKKSIEWQVLEKNERGGVMAESEKVEAEDTPF